MSKPGLHVVCHFLLFQMIITIESILNHTMGLNKLGLSYFHSPSLSLSLSFSFFHQSCLPSQLQPFTFTYHCNPGLPHEDMVTCLSVGALYL